MSEKLFGKYRAIVESVNDPEKRGRLLVRCPVLNEDDAIGWAEACLPPGVFLLPSKGDAVYIEFEEGNMERPVWVGMLPTNKYIRETFFPEGDYDPAAKIIVVPETLEILAEDDVFVTNSSDRKRVARAGDEVTVTVTVPTIGTANGTGTIV